MQTDLAKYYGAEREHFSSLKHMAISPLEYRYRNITPVPTTDSMAFGAACHSAILTTVDFLEPYRLAPSVDRRGADYKRWRASLSPDVIPLAMDAWTAIQTIKESVWQRVKLSDWNTEHAIYWDAMVEQHGSGDCVTVPLKSRLDGVHKTGRGLLEIKVVTSRYFAPHRFAYHARDMYYHAQLAMYYDAMLSRGLTPDPVTLVVAQKEAPYDALAYDVPYDVIDAGRTMYTAWLKTLLKCRATEKWPGMAPTNIPFSLPYTFDKEGD